MLQLLQLKTTQKKFITIKPTPRKQRISLNAQKTVKIYEAKITGNGESLYFRK